MKDNNLLNFFGEDTSQDQKRVLHYDWNSSSVGCVYIIFITGRCGSTWLTHLLEDSGICGHPHELFNETMMPRFNRTVNANNFKDYFTGVVDHFSSGGRFGFKIDEYRFRHLLPLIDFGSVFPMSLTKFFWMTRTDLLDQAFSYARAKASGHWHDFAMSLDQQRPGDIQLSDVQLWKEIFDIVAKESRMKAFFAAEGIEPIRLNYEQMTADRFLTVMNVMLELQCPPDVVETFIEKMEDKTLKLQFGNKYRILGEFCAKYKPLLRILDEQRKCVNTEELRARLQSDYNLSL